MSVLAYWNSLFVLLNIIKAISQSHSTLSSYAFFIRPNFRFVNVTYGEGGEKKADYEWVVLLGVVALIASWRGHPGATGRSCHHSNRQWPLYEWMDGGSANIPAGYVRRWCEIFESFFCPSCFWFDFLFTVKEEDNDNEERRRISIQLAERERPAAESAVLVVHEKKELVQRNSFLLIIVVANSYLWKELSGSNQLPVQTLGHFNLLWPEDSKRKKLISKI